MSLVLKDLECRSLASLDAGVIAHDFAIDGVPKRIYQAQDVLYLAELQTVVVDDFVPEEAILYPHHLDVHRPKFKDVVIDKAQDPRRLLGTLPHRCWVVEQRPFEGGSAASRG